MQNFNLTQQKYSENAANMQLVMPLNVEVLIPENDSVRLLSQIVEELDFTDLKMAYSSKGRNPQVPPRILFQLLVYAYMNGIYSSRKVELACKRDINFMWLLEGYPAPDHNTVCRFRRLRLSSCMEKLFSQFVVKLSALGEIQFKHLFVDGTKIESAANKYSFVWKKAVNKNESKLQANIDKLIEDVNQNYGMEFSKEDQQETLQAISHHLSMEKEKQEIEFVRGKGKRKTVLQRLAEKTSEYSERQKKYTRYNELFKGRNSFSKTDTDATFMHMKEDHMRNAQLKPGYNIQIGVEGGYVVGIDVSSERSDKLTLIPFLKRLEENLPKTFRNIIADAGYESEEIYLYLKKHRQRAYIKPQIYEQWKKRNFKELIGKRENMIYHKDEDVYECNQGRRLKKVNKSSRVSKSGYRSDITVYESENCEGCLVKSQCTKAKGNRRMDVSKKFLKLRERSLKNIVTPKGIVLRMNRSIQVEGAFGIMKEDYGFRRFLTRGKENVRVEYLLLCFGYNINRLHQKIQMKKIGQLLYEKQVA